jgi:hypothetical protein
MAWDFELLCKQKPEVAEAMEALGRCAPTVNEADKHVKGQAIDWVDGGTHKRYFTSDELVRIGTGAIEMAKWLDCRVMSGN